MVFGIFGKNAPSNTPLESLDDVMRYVKAHGAGRAGERIRKEALEGNLSCQLFLSQASLHYGDHENAELFTRLAAEAGDAGAQFNLALILIKLVNAQSDYLSQHDIDLIQQSMMWHKRAADQGVSAAKQSLEQLTAAFPHLVSNDHADADGMVAIPDALTEVSMTIARHLPNVIRTEGDLWTFVVLEFDRLRANEDVNDFIRFLPVQIHDIECTWAKPNPPLPNPGLAYIRDHVAAALSGRFDKDIVNLTAAHAFSQYCLEHIDEIQRIRLGFATHFRNQCISEGRTDLSKQWSDVVNSLGGR